VDEDDRGVVVAADEAGRRSSSAVGRAVVADALRSVDPVGAQNAEREVDWRRGYLRHFRRILEAGLASRAAAITVAADGLTSLHRRMRYRTADGPEVEVGSLPEFAAVDQVGTETVRGSGPAQQELTVPVGDERLSGQVLRRRLEHWAEAGVLEPSAAERVATVIDNPDWLRLSGTTVVALGAGAEMGPVPSLLAWGATVAAVDLPRQEIWQRLRATAARGAGTMLLPVRDGTPGLDLLQDLSAAEQWVRRLDSRLVLGNYVYADGVRNLRLSTAVDVLTLRLLERRGELALAFLATPTDAFAVPAGTVAAAARAFDGRSRAAKIVGGALRAVTGGRLLQRQYTGRVDPEVHDALVGQQGPNYALAKRLQRWRATVARAEGRTVSLNVAPPARTRSVVKNRALAAAYAGAHRFGVTVFEPATANTLMAALMVADLQDGGGPVHDHPWQDEAYAAVHGGLWRAPYQPRTALGLAAVLGYAAARP
jgi:hypothetical protein